MNTLELNIDGSVMTVLVYVSKSVYLSVSRIDSRIFFEIIDCLNTVLFVLIECIFQIVQTRPYTQVQLSPYPATCIQIKQRIHAKMAMRT